MCLGGFEIHYNITLLQEVLDTLLIDGAFTVNCSIFSLNFFLKTRCQSNLIQMILLKWQ